jgi:FAD/FMN-containing dehydrogenase
MAHDIDIAGLDGGSVGLTPEQLDDLDSRLEGRLLLPGRDGWNDAVEMWNGMVAKIPALVLQPASAGDVSTAVDFARDHELLLSVKGGGHHIAGTAIAENGLTLDMSSMRSVRVDPEARLAQVGPGCLLQDVDRATQEHGLATVLGFVSETGVAGLTLGGGFGYLARRFGWAADNLEEVEIVTADGRLRVANREAEPELFWAIRGGGGNFGVVTRFTFRLHEVGPMITGGLMAWSADRIEEVLDTYRELTESAPRELTAAIVVMFAPPVPFVPEQWHGRPVIAMLICHSGPDPQADLAPLRALGDPVVDLIAERPYVEQQSLLDDTEPNGMHYYWKTEFVPELSQGFLEAYREHALGMTPPLSDSVIFHIGGALNEHPSDDGAVNRDARYVMGFAGMWAPDDDPERHVTWARESWQAIRPYATGNYVNFQLAEDGSDRTIEAYRGNYVRLQRAKAQYDPANLFRVNRNISPAS